MIVQSEYLYGKAKGHYRYKAGDFFNHRGFLGDHTCVFTSMRHTESTVKDRRLSVTSHCQSV